MDESTRRTLCRLAYLLLCVLPTACALTLILYRHSPMYRAASARHWEQKLFERLGLITRIQRVSRLTRGSAVLEGVELLDAETGRGLARLRVLELARTDHGQVVLVSQPEIEDGQFLRLWEVLHERVLRGPRLDEPVRLLSREVTLRGAQGQTFTDVQCSIEQRQTGLEVLIDFRLAGVPSRSASQLRIVRNRERSPPTTAWQLRTGSAALPCSIFAAYLPVLESLGPACRFKGMARSDRSAAGAHGEIVGRFRDLDLDQLMQPFPHKLSGTAEVVLQRASFQNGRLQDAAGSIQADFGVISRSLVEACADALQLQLGPAARRELEPLLKYQQLALGFELLDTKLKVSGICGGAPAGTILLRKTGPLLTEATAETIPVVALARALSPGSEFLVPATKETRLLVAALPIPTGSTDSPRQAQQEYVPLRLREE